MGLGWDPEVRVSFDRLFLPVAENSDERRRGSLVLSGLWGLSPQLATLAALRRHRTTKFGEERSLAAGLANSRILPYKKHHPGSRGWLLPSARDALHWVQNRSNSTASTRAMQIQEGAEHRRNFPRLRTGSGGWLGFAGEGGLVEAGETPPTSFSSLLRPTLGARRHGQPERWAAPER